MNYLGMQKLRYFKDSLDFILWQQRPDGRFGFFAPEVSCIRNKDPKFNEKRCLYLPITVSAMWTIAEILDPKFSVYHSI